MPFRQLSKISVRGALLAVIGASLLVSSCQAFTEVKISRNQILRTTAPLAASLIPSSSKPNDTDPVFDTIMRFELKQELLQAAQEFQELQQEMFAAKQEEKNKTKRKWFQRRNKDPIGGKYY